MISHSLRLLTMSNNVEDLIAHFFRWSFVCRHDEDSIVIIRTSSCGFGQTLEGGGMCFIAHLPVEWGADSFGGVVLFNLTAVFEIYLIDTVCLLVWRCCVS